jgi:hypothetical protein
MHLLREPSRVLTMSALSRPIEPPPPSRLHRVSIASASRREPSTGGASRRRGEEEGEGGCAAPVPPRAMAPAALFGRDGAEEDGEGGADECHPNDGDGGGHAHLPRHPSAVRGEEETADGMGWDGMGWDGMGWDGMGWDEESRRGVGVRAEGVGRTRKAEKWSLARRNPKALDFIDVSMAKVRQVCSSYL